MPQSVQEFVFNYIEDARQASPRLSVRDRRLAFTAGATKALRGEALAGPPEAGSPLYRCYPVIRAGFEAMQRYLAAGGEIACEDCGTRLDRGGAVPLGAMCRDRASKIVGHMVRLSFDPDHEEAAEALRRYSLAQLLEANAKVAHANQEEAWRRNEPRIPDPEPGGESPRQRVIHTVLDDRLIAALYTALHYELGGGPTGTLGIASVAGKTLALLRTPRAGNPEG